MLRQSFFLLAMGIVSFLLCSVSSAEIPHMINYQGKLTTVNGGCLNDTVQMIFSIYSDTLGSPAVWAETQTQVAVKEGIFSVLLGSVSSIPASVFDGNIKYLGVKVKSDPEMRPLKPMVSVGYAFHSTTADTAFTTISAGLVSIDSVSNPGGNVDLIQTNAIRITANDDSNTITIGETHSVRTDNPHMVTAAQTGALVSTDGVSNPGGNVDLIPSNSIIITPDDGANTITIGETHSGRTDNPHMVNATQTGALVSLDGISNPGGDVDLVAGANMIITPNPSTKSVTFSATGGGGWTDDGTVVRLQTSTDSVGIGTTSPEAMLHVRSGGGIGSIRVESNTGVKGGFNAYNTYSRIGSDTNHDFLIASNSISRIWVKTDGKIGIGTSSPAQALDVSGTAQMTGFKMPTGASTGYVLTSDVSGMGTWQAPAGGMGGSGSTNYIPKFTAATTLGNSVIYQSGSLVGIGTTSPAYNLHVNGSFYATTVNTGQGDNELYAMNQNVRTTDNPTFNQVNLSDYGTALGGFHVGSTSDPGIGNLIVDGNVGIGTASPSCRLQVVSTSDRSGYFTSDYLSPSTHVLHAEFTGTGGYDAQAVYGRCIPADYYGVGGYFEAGYIGVEGRVTPTGSQDYRGVAGYVSGGSGTNYGVYGQAISGSAHVGVYYSGGLAGTGTKSCVVKTSKGPTLLYCQESPENWFEDFGEGRLVNGRVHVALDALFLETVTIDATNPMKIFVQLEGDCNGVYVSKGTTSFDVIELNGGNSNVPFSYRVVAKRKGFENKRLDYTKAGENDPYLYPESAAKQEKERLEKNSPGQ